MAATARDEMGLDLLTCKTVFDLTWSSALWKPQGVFVKNNQRQQVTMCSEIFY